MSPRPNKQTQLRQSTFNTFESFQFTSRFLSPVIITKIPWKDIVSTTISIGKTLKIKNSTFSVCLGN
jgi:hypothetical protein